jgi:hypothetical protein
MNHSSHHGAGALIFLGIFLLVAGGGFLFWGLSARRKADARATLAATWPVAPGVVIAVQVVQRYMTGAAIVTGQIQDRGRHYYEPVVHYRYTVGEAQYEGNRLRFGWLTYTSPGAAQGVLAAYPVGRQLPARFDPSNPANSVLEVAVANKNAMVGIVFGGIMVAFGLLMLVISLKGH